MKLRICVAISAVLIASVPIVAHHSFSAEYDTTMTITLKGVITKVDWSNPHIHIFVDVKDPSGKTTTWNMEGGPPNALYRRGVRPNFINIGEAVTVSGFRARDSSARASRFEVTTNSGQKIDFGGAGEFSAVP